MDTLTELQNYLTERNLFNQFTWTGNIEHFRTFTTAEGLSRQVSFQTLPLDAKFWIDYIGVTDEFILRVSYFTHQGISVTKEQFVAEIDNKYPATRHNNENAIRWKNQGLVYVFDMPSDAVIRIPSANISLKV
jgi:hypothetical protein